MRKVPESDEENAVTSDMPRRRIVLGKDVTQAAAYVEHMVRRCPFLFGGRRDVVH